MTKRCPLWGRGGFTTNYSVDQRQGRRWPRPMPLVARNILWVGALHPGTIGPRCLTMLPRCNISSCGAATALRVALHVLRGSRVARVHRRAYRTPNAPNATKCIQYTKIPRPLSVADFNLRRESRGPSARARAFVKKFVSSFPRWKRLEHKFANLLLRCAQWTHLGSGILHFFGGTQ